MKINKKISTLALGLTLLLGIGAPMAVHASSCQHNPVGQTRVTTYTHEHKGKTCTVTQTCTLGVCTYCGSVVGETCQSSHTVK
ncbi:MAG: hypothetical protein AB9856_01135 [Cellulosilyticaceae bacterium]